MRWQGREGSGNFEDRRGQSSGGGRGIPLRGGAGVVVLLVVLVAGFYGIDLTPLLNGTGGVSTTEPYVPTEQDEEMARFSSVALRTTEETWQQIFNQAGRTYSPPHMVLYSGVTETACGYGQAAMGPFYCPPDQTVYLDLSFFHDMASRLGGGGDFAQGYVIAHEVGHHVQHLLGIEQRARQMQQGASQAETNRISVRLELQADCFAGVWGHAMNQQGILEAGDLEEALRTAEAIGDDRLQRQSSGRVVPDSFTHGTSEQRYTWFKRGYDSGDMNQCNTFATGSQ